MAATVLSKEEDLQQLEHQPYVPSETILPELTWRAAILGAFFGIIVRR